MRKKIVEAKIAHIAKQRAYALAKKLSWEKIEGDLWEFLSAPSLHN